MYIENNNHDQQYYLKRMAALQFPGSRENYDTRQPLHLLQQQSSDRSLERRFWNAYQDDQLEGAYYSLAGHDNEEYHNIEELAMAYLGIDNEEDIDDYNADRLEFDETPFRKMRDNEDEFDYLSALDIPIDDIHVFVQSRVWETIALGFTHQELENQRKLLDNHIFEATRTYAKAGSSYGRDNNEVSSIMSFLQDAGEQLLMDDLQHLEFTRKSIMPVDTVIHQYIENPRQITKAVELVVKNKAAALPSDAKAYTVNVMVGGEMKPYGFHGENVPRAYTRYVEVDAETVDGHMTRTHYPYPFSGDETIESLHKLPQSGKRSLLPYERLFFYAVYKTPLTFEKFKQICNGVTV